jgi:hypothetical protein
LADAAGATVPGAEVDPCPLCGAPLHPDQDWCLRCGAAARTRLVASSSWKGPIIAVAVVAALALAVLAAALVKLAGNSGSTSTVVVVATSTAGQGSVTSPATPAPAATPPAASTPTASTPATAPAVALVPLTRVTPTTVVLKGAVNPQGVSTTYQFQYGTSTRYGNALPSTPLAVGAGTAAVGVGYRIEYLARGTTYHYRLTATKAGRAISTADATFTNPR